MAKVQAQILPSMVLMMLRTGDFSFMEAKAMIESMAVIGGRTTFGEALATILYKVEVTERPHISMVTKVMMRSLQEQPVATSLSNLAKVTIHSLEAVLGPVTST